MLDSKISYSHVMYSSCMNSHVMYSSCMNVYFNDHVEEITFQLANTQLYRSPFDQVRVTNAITFNIKSINCTNI